MSEFEPIPGRDPESDIAAVRGEWYEDATTLTDVAVNEYVYTELRWGRVRGTSHSLRVGGRPTEMERRLAQASPAMVKRANGVVRTAEDWAQYEYPEYDHQPEEFTKLINGVWQKIGDERAGRGRMLTAAEITALRDEERTFFSATNPDDGDGDVFAFA